MNKRSDRRLLIKILSIFIVITLLFSSFFVVASADVTSELVEFIATWLLDSSVDIAYGDMSADDLIDWYNTLEGQAFLAAYSQGVLGIAGGALLPSYVQDANGARYQVAEVTKNQLQNLNQMLNDYWKSDSAPIRNTSLESLGLSFYGTDTLKSSWGYISGRNSFVVRAGTSPDESIWYNPRGSERDFGHIYLYNGSIYCPPIIYVSSKNLLFQSGQALPVGFYIILNNSELLYCDSTYSNNKMRMTFSVGSTLNDITLFSDRGSHTQSPYLYSGGTGEKINTATLTGLTVMDKVTKAIGLHIVTDNNNVINLPSNIPYDDNNTVTVLVPVDEPSEPVYLSPDVYNNYIDNGTYTTINEGDFTNNIVNDEQVTNITNIYNNYITNNYYGDNGGSGSSGYDDSNFISKLSGWFNSLFDKIDFLTTKINTSLSSVNVGDVLGFLSDFLGTGDEDTLNNFRVDFSSLLQSKFPLLLQVQSLVDDLKKTNSPLVIETTHPLNWLLPSDDPDNPEPYGKWVINVAWFENEMADGRTGREYIRSGLSIIMYIVTFGALFRKTDYLLHDF